MYEMKALVIDDPSVSGMPGTLCHAGLEALGHTAQFINAPLLYEAEELVRATRLKWLTTLYPAHET